MRLGGSFVVASGEVLLWKVDDPGGEPGGDGVPAARPGLGVGPVPGPVPDLVSVIDDRLGGGAEGDAARGLLGEAGTAGEDDLRVTTAA